MSSFFSRRELVDLALAAAGLGLLPASAGAQGISPGANPMFPARFLKVLGFFDERDPEWYESVHAPDFLSFAAPHMARYARNWIKDVEAGEAPEFGVITEIQYKNEAAKNDVRRLMDTAAAKPLLEHSISRRAARAAAGQPTPRDDRLRLFSVEPVALTRRAAPAEGPSTVHRRVLLLRRPDKAGQSAFQAAAAALARDVARIGPDVGVSLDVFSLNPQAGPADAVIYVANAEAATLPVPADEAVRVHSILRVETRSSMG